MRYLRDFAHARHGDAMLLFGGKLMDARFDGNHGAPGGMLSHMAGALGPRHIGKWSWIWPHVAHWKPGMLSSFLNYFEDAASFSMVRMPNSISSGQKARVQPSGVLRSSSRYTRSFKPVLPEAQLAIPRQGCGLHQSAPPRGPQDLPRRKSRRRSLLPPRS